MRYWRPQTTGPEFEFLRANGISVGEAVASKEQMMSKYGAALGKAAGDKISFTTQVSSKDASRFALK